MALVGVRSELLGVRHCSELLLGVRHAVCSTCTMIVCSYMLCDSHFTGMNDFEVSMKMTVSLSGLLVILIQWILLP